VVNRKEIGNEKHEVIIESKREIVTTVGPARFVVGPLFSGTRLVTAGDGWKPGSSVASRTGGGSGICQRGFPLREFSVKGFFGSSSPKS